MVKVLWGTLEALFIWTEILKDGWYIAIKFTALRFGIVIYCMSMSSLHLTRVYHLCDTRLVVLVHVYQVILVIKTEPLIKLLEGVWVLPPTPSSN